MLSLTRQILAAALLIGVLGGGWWLLQPTDDAGPAAGRGFRGGPPTVVVAAVEAAPLVERFRGIGSAGAVRSISVFPQASGEVVELAVSAGDRVAAGAMLVRLDDAVETLSLERAEVDVEDARLRFNRIQQLRPSGAVSASQMDEARLALASAEASAATARLALERRTVRAPFDGVVGIPRVSIGERVDGSTPLLTLDDRSSLYVDLDLPERLAGQVQLCQLLEATTASLPGARFEAVVAALDSRVDTATRSLQVRAEIPNDDDLLRPGMSFSLTLDLTGGQQLSVPPMAVQWERDGPFVWRVRDGVANRASIELIQRQEDRVIVGGEALTVGDLVAVEGLHRLRSGVSVETRPTDGPNGGPRTGDPAVADAPTG